MLWFVSSRTEQKWSKYRRHCRADAMKTEDSGNPPITSQNVKYVCCIYVMAVLAGNVSGGESKQGRFSQIEKCVYFSCLMAISSINGNSEVRLFYLILHKIGSA